MKSLNFANLLNGFFWPTGQLSNRPTERRDIFQTIDLIAYLNSMPNRLNAKLSFS